MNTSQCSAKKEENDFARFHGRPPYFSEQKQPIQQMQTNELREKYLAFFETKGCVRKPSDVLVPRWDPSVLFTPAGMNQFKDQFMGRCKLEFTKATTCQKCLRTGDIDNVGRTAYHHTFFERLWQFYNMPVASATTSSGKRFTGPGPLRICTASPRKSGLGSTR